MPPRLERSNGVGGGAKRAHGDPARSPRPACRRPDLVGRLRGSGLGSAAAPDRVFAEMVELGITATELGPLGWLPVDGAAARAVLDRYGLQLVGGFVPVVVHEPDLPGPRAHAPGRRAARAGRRRAVRRRDRAGRRLVSAGRRSMQDGWKRAGEHLRRARRRSRPRRASSSCCTPTRARSSRRRPTSSSRWRTRDVPWCLDTGHLLIGGVDPVDFATAHGERIGHVHFKDVDPRRRAPARGRADADAGRAGRPVPAAGRRGRADRRGRRCPPPLGLRALARARAGPRHHRVGAPGRQRSGARCRQEHRVPVHPGSGGDRVSTDEARRQRRSPGSRTGGRRVRQLEQRRQAANDVLQRRRRRRAHAGHGPHVRDGHALRRGLVLVGRQEGRRAGGQGRGRQARSGARRTTTRRRRRS